MTEDEDSLTIEEVVYICNKAQIENIEVKKNNPFNTKTGDFIDRYDINPNQIKSIINDLTINDYHSGPLQDFNPNNKHPLWVFIKNTLIKNLRIYIYIKIKIIDHKRKIIVYSLHEEGMHNEKK